LEKYVIAEAFIDALTANGVECIFYNPGIDNVPVLETLSKYRASGKQSPRGILCLDEFVAMTAAHGHYMVSGRPQVVSVHSELGTLQVGGALHNAQWGRVPVVLFAEPLGPTQRVNWRHEPFDQGSMVRNFVKWDHQLGDNEDIRDVLQEAFRIATTDPCGPVYLTLPRETIWNKTNALPSRTTSVAAKATPQCADDAALNKAADLLIHSENPLIVTGYSGRNHQSVASLVALAETLCARVFTADIRMNFPNTHPLSACLSPGSGFGNPFLTTADVILAIDYDIPYAPPPTKLAAGVKIIHIDIDTAKQGVPLWGCQPDVLIAADSAQTITALNEIIRRKLTPERRQQFHERFKRIEAEYKKRQEEWKVLAMSQAEQIPISANYLCHCIDEVITKDTIIVNQTITPSMIVAHQIHRSIPGTLLSCAGGSIGWALGASLGVKLAAPDRIVVSLMGDGAFIYGCPEASLWSASYYHAPFLSIIFNNSGYGAIKGLFQKTYNVDNMGADIVTPPDYALVARACNAYGRTVVNPTEVLPALRDILEQVHRGQPAVLDVKLKPV
jgi:acetolactate synthase-1/2/3 large subunit